MLAGMTQQETDRQNEVYCKSVSKKLSDVCEGLYGICPECGEIVRFDENASLQRCENCDAVGEKDDFDSCDCLDVLGEIFDVEYYIGGDGDYRGVRLMIACGGPNVYVDTREHEVQLYWWTDHAKCYLPTDVCDQIDARYEEIFEGMKAGCFR